MCTRERSKAREWRCDTAVRGLRQRVFGALLLPLALTALARRDTGLMIRSAQLGGADAQVNDREGREPNEI
jgi:hypothetical protein